jgi:glycine/D-amino acid oxidase-like deaminating enzyme
VVVIGGGIVGASTTFEFAERGAFSCLVRKRRHRLRAVQPELGLGLSRRDVREMPLMLEAMKIWSGLAERTAQDVGYPSGIVFTVAPEGD